MAVVSKMVADLVLQSAQFESGMQKASRTVSTFGETTAKMERGLAMAERGFTMLAFRAASIEGPIGKISEGLLQFGIGGTTMLGVVAGLGAIGLAMKAMGDAAEEATKRTDALITTSRSGAFGARAAQGPLRNRISQIVTENQQSINANFLGIGGAVMVPLGGPEGAEKRQEEALRIIHALQAALLQTKETAEELDNKDLITKTTVLFRELNQQAGTYDSILASIAVSNAQFFGTFTSKPMTGQEMFAANIAASDKSILAGAPGVSGAIAAAMAGLGPNPLKGFNLPTAPKIGRGIGTDDIVLALLGATQGALHGGGLGSVLGGGLGLAGTALFGPLGGAVGGFLGSEIGGLFGGHKKVHVQDDAILKELQKQGRTGPDTITVIVQPSANGGDFQKFVFDAKSRSRRDRIDRVPIYLPA